MIKMPQRSVTRFFIPMVDVMMLMFSIFLLLPILESASSTTADLDWQSRKQLIRNVQSLRTKQKELPKIEREHKLLTKDVKRLRDQNRALQRYANLEKTKEKLQQEVSDLIRRRDNLIRNLFYFRILEIDPNDGKLVWYEPTNPPKRHELDSQQAARELIRKDTAFAKSKGREMYFLILLPRTDARFSDRQLRTYQRWFSGVPSGIQ